MRLLIIEDNAHCAKHLSLGMAQVGFVSEVISSHEQIGQNVNYDLVITDANACNGFKVCLFLRNQKSYHGPIMILSGDTSLESKLKGFASGADDYVGKDCHAVELRARARCLVNRASSMSNTVLGIGHDLEIDLSARMVRRTSSGAHVNLTGKEYCVLEVLAMNKGKVQPKENFLNNLYSGIDEPELKIIDVFICKLRKKLANASCDKEFKTLATVWGRGYVLHATPASSSHEKLAEEAQD